MLKSLIYWILLVPALFIISILIPALFFIYINIKLLNIFLSIIILILLLITVYVFLIRKFGRVTKIISISLLFIFLIQTIILNLSGVFSIDNYKNNNIDWVSDQYHKFDEVFVNEQYYYLIGKITGFQEKLQFIELYKSKSKFSADGHNCYNENQLKTSKLIFSEVLDLEWKDQFDNHGTRHATGGKIDLKNNKIIVYFNNGDEDIFEIKEDFGESIDNNM